MILHDQLLDTFSKLEVNLKEKPSSLAGTSKTRDRFTTIVFQLSCLSETINGMVSFQPVLHISAFGWFHFCFDLPGDLKRHRDLLDYHFLKPCPECLPAARAVGSSPNLRIEHRCRLQSLSLGPGSRAKTHRMKKKKMIDDDCHIFYYPALGQ